MKTKEEWLDWLKQSPSWPIFHGYRVDVDGCLGLGATAIAFRARMQGEAEDVCLKFMDEESNSPTGEAVRDAVYYHAENWRCRYFVTSLADELREKHPQGSDCIAIPLELAVTNLEDHCNKKVPVSIAEFLDLARSLTAALSTVHKRGLVFRDLKPANVGVFEEHPRFRILDLGSICPQIEDQKQGSLRPQKTQSRCDHTPWFVAPERFKAGEATAKSDIFELGATLLCALGGGPRFGNSNGQLGRLPLAQVGEVIEKLAEDADWLQIFESEREAKKELSSFLEDLLAENPADRPHRIKDVQNRLRHLGRLLEGSGTLPFLAWAGVAFVVVITGMLAAYMVINQVGATNANGTNEIGGNPDTLKPPPWSEPEVLFDANTKNWTVHVSGASRVGEFIFQGRKKDTGYFVVKEVVEQKPGEFIIPPDLWAGFYLLAWKAHPEKWQKQIPISPRVSQVSVPLRAADGTFRAAISTQIVVNVLGSNLDERMSVRVGGLVAVPLSAKDNGRWEPTAMTYLFTCPPEPGLHELVLELGSEQLWKGTIEFFSEALESVLRLAAQPIPFELWMQLLSNPSQAQSALRAIEKLTDWNEELQRRLTQLTGEKLRLPDKVATALAEQLERVESAQFNRRLYLAKSSKCIYREVYEATCKDLQAVADLRATLIAVSDAGEPLKEFVARREKDSKETREYLSRLIGAVGPAFAALPVATTIRARLDDLLAKECIRNALKISEDDVVEKRREKLSTAISKGWMKFTLGITVMDSKEQHKPITVGGEWKKDRFDLSGELTLKDIHGTEYVYLDLRMPDGRKDIPARWELGDTVKVVIIVSYNIPLFDWEWTKNVPGAKKLESSSEGEYLQDGFWIEPSATDPPGNTLVLFLREDWPGQAFKPVFSPPEEVTRRERLAPEAFGRMKEPHLFR